METNLLEAAELADSAVKFDKLNCIDAAAYYYREAARLIIQASESLTDDSRSEFTKWLTKAKEYNERADHITSPERAAAGVCTGPGGAPPASPSPTIVKPEVHQLNRCKFLFYHAIDADEDGHIETAIDLYTQAVELCILTRSKCENEEINNNLLNLSKQALERAEQLKGKKAQVAQSFAQPNVVPTTSRRVGHSEQKQKVESRHARNLIVCGNASLTKEEKEVLLATSRINKIDYVPFMDIDLNEKFQYAIVFNDKHGLLKLSPKQSKVFDRWLRPEDICRQPVMFQNGIPDCYSLKQTIISDCSFVASLAVSSLYEKRFPDRPKLISSIIYPKNRQKQPVYNPFGKYMIKLHLNGVLRKVIIDDLLPVGRHNELLCSYSTNKNEIWVSLLEKAYMKVMGGYDFPGSNSSIDLHALTGWIPEREGIRTNDPDFNSESLFQKILTRMHNGDLLVTVATGELTQVEADRAGLIPTHAYAVLDARLINGVKLLKLKNPWSHVRWKGNYSELDKINWTESMQKALNYDPKSAEMFDNGVFWIDYNSILKFFDVFYMNWNPQMFKYTFSLHQCWSGGVGPIKDRYTIGENPQYCLTIDDKTVGSSGSVWILLTRHITSIEDFKFNSEYITLLVYKNNGNRVYYPNDPPPYIDGVRINSPHYLTKIILNDNSPRKFTLVLSQYEKSTTIYYTLRAYSTCVFNLSPIVDPYRHTIKIKDGRWEGSTAGGCRNHPTTYNNNPIYKIDIDSSSCQLLIDLKAPKEFCIGIEVRSPNNREFQTVSTAPYRSGFVVLELNLQPGVYEVIPSTFLPGQESPFLLSFKSSAPIRVNRIK